ncbi:hypothetical protein, partial [Segatella copri]|uniref:hypothetical protein n=1 Tax=Segatella copri TaxID=165179 RepID=UPI002230BAB2
SVFPPSILQQFSHKRKHTLRGNATARAARACPSPLKNKKTIAKTLNFQGIFIGSFSYSFLSSFSPSVTY